MQKFTHTREHSGGGYERFRWIDGIFMDVKIFCINAHMKNLHINPSVSSLINEARLRQVKREVVSSNVWDSGDKWAHFIFNIKKAKPLQVLAFYNSRSNLHKQHFIQVQISWVKS